MPICSRCKCEFNLGDTKRMIGRRFGSGVYDDYYPNEDVCEDCALEEISADYETGEDNIELMYTGWGD